jgi:hypothetical protein
MKPHPRIYLITSWLENWGFGAPSEIEAKDAFEAAEKFRNKIFTKYGNNTELIITKIEPK